jgi:hypothetical protein
MPNVFPQRFNVFHVCSTALLVAFGAAGCAADATGTTDESVDKASAATTTESITKESETKVDSKTADPSHSIESKVEPAGFACTAAVCNAGCESCGGSGGYCTTAVYNHQVIEVCGCHRQCI